MSKLSITLTQADFEKARVFAESFANARKDEMDFGSTLHRDKIDVIADNINGKLGEIAFAKLCAERGILIDLDFEVRQGRENSDGGNDIPSYEIDGTKYQNTCKTDIKTSRSYAKWLLVDKSKFGADNYILMTTSLPKDFEQNPVCPSAGIKITFEGFASDSDFFKADKAKWQYNKNDRLYDPETLPKGVESRDDLEELLSYSTRKSLEIGGFLKSPCQYGLPKKNLNPDLDKCIEYMHNRNIDKDIEIKKSQKKSEDYLDINGYDIDF